MKKRFIKLINNEKLSKKLTSAKACTEGATDYCPVNQDFADCTTYALDSCRKEDRAGCYELADDICSIIDYAACYSGAEDHCKIDVTVCFGPGVEDTTL